MGNAVGVLYGLVPWLWYSIVSNDNEEAIQKRKRITDEVLSTERTYSESLSSCVNEIVVPLLDGNDQLLSTGDAKKIFGKLVTVNDTHIAFYSELQRYVDKNKPVGALFVSYEEEFKVNYSSFVNSYNAALRMLSQRRQASDNFDQFLHEKKVKVNNQEVESILIMPVQRLPRYVMLLKDLLKHTPNYTRHRKITEEALETMTEVTRFVNDEKRIAEQQHEIMEVQESLSSSSEVLVKRGRYIVKKGTLAVQNKSSLMQYVLFNDLILFTTESSMSKLANMIHVSDSHKLKEKDRCPLAVFKVELMDPEVNVAIVKTENNKWRLKFRSTEEMADW
eukprot:CAMPEP_0206203400 /NCGR_PEP_ID=MMETSP0166-20121206/12819_1 /ASSEMBLY_ACC=CAM_ASM_000260 /TAXON_ID=95228 /ORGANISM="Vannella robusta, Strain DIVA3 518/3/11/1/6" /LENGTH=334 /DNA_ID=CAMNT_0053622655 /DNA_START=401 /DNA_END=1402 /DNA_ORIENTATION=-